MPLRIPRAKLRTRIIAWSFIPTTIILLAVALVVFYAYQQVTGDLVIGRNQELTRLSAGQLATGLTDYVNELVSLARTSDIYQNDPAAQSAALRQASNHLLVFDGGVVVLNHLGQVTAAEPARPEILGQDWSNRVYFRQILRSATSSFSDIVPDGPGGASVIVLAVPILSDRGEFRGTMLGMFRLGATTFSSFYGSIVKLRLSESGNSYVVDSAGRVIYDSDTARIGSDASSQAAVQEALKRQTGYLHSRDFQNKDILATFAPVPGTPWGLVNEEDWSSLLAASRGYGEFLLLLLALGVIVPTAVVTFGVRRITDPVAKLINAAQKIAEGDFGQQINVHTGDELEELAKQFNRMSTRLADSYTELKEREERLSLVIEGTNDGIWDWNLETNVVYFSPHWKGMLGYADHEIANRVEEWYRLMHPDDAAGVKERLQAYLKGQLPVYELEHRLRHKDGSYRWILARGIALRRTDGTPYRMAGSHTDITERKRADEVIRQSEKRFSQVFHASPIPITITSLEGGLYVEVNDAWLRLFEYTREEVIGDSSLHLNLWVDPQQRLEMIQQLQATGSLRDYAHLARTKTGKVLDVLVSAEVMELNDQHYNLSLVYDVTELKRAQQRLEQRVEERTHKLATLNAIAAVVSGSLDLKQVLNAALSKAMEAMHMEVGSAYSLEDGDTPDEEKHLFFAALQGLSPEFTRRVGSRQVRGTAIQVAMEAHKPLVWLVADYPDPYLKQALELEGVRQVINVPLFAKGKFVGAFNLGTRHEREIAPEEISLLSAIGHQVAVAVENARLYDQAEQSALVAERTRLARELHDSVTQSLYGVTLYAEAAATLLKEGNQVTAAEHLRELRDTAQEALREMRLLIFELRPLALEKSGLGAALQARLDAVEARGGIKSELRVEGEDQLPLSMQQELYHITREALNNVVKHAHAQHVSITLRTAGGQCYLEICDDGAGFDAAGPSRGGLGLAGIRERVQKMGGQVEIASTSGKGTTVRVQVPAGDSPEPPRVPPDSVHSHTEVK